jgi:hypothetical protein
MAAPVIAGRGPAGRGLEPAPAGMRRLAAAQLGVYDLGDFLPRADDLAVRVPAQGTDEVALVLVGQAAQLLDLGVRTGRVSGRNCAGLGTVEQGSQLSQYVRIAEHITHASMIR